MDIEGKLKVFMVCRASFLELDDIARILLEGIVCVKDDTHLIVEKVCLFFHILQPKLCILGFDGTFRFVDHGIQASSAAKGGVRRQIRLWQRRGLVVQ